MSLTLVISLLLSYGTADYRAHADRRLDKANLIGEVCKSSLKKYKTLISPNFSARSMLQLLPLITVPTCGTWELAVTVLSCAVTRHTRSLKQFCTQQIVVLNLSAVKKNSTKSSVRKKNEFIISKFILYYNENNSCQNMRVAGLSVSTVQKYIGQRRLFSLIRVGIKTILYKEYCKPEEYIMA
jgi:hypothetical protein